MARIRFRAQSSELDCGAACLSMMLFACGRYHSVPEIAGELGAGRAGVSARQIIETAARFGLTLQARSLRIENLRQLPLPCILHWEFRHWVVLRGVDARCLALADPAVGFRKVPRALASERFTGVALVPRDFGRCHLRHQAESRSPWRRIFGGLLGQRRAVIVGGVALLTLTLATQFLNILLAVTSGWLIDGRSAKSPMMAFLAALICACLLARVFMDQSRSVLLGYFRAKVDSRALVEVVGGILARSFEFLTAHGAGSLAARVQSFSLVRQLATEEPACGDRGFSALGMLLWCALLFQCTSVCRCGFVQHRRNHHRPCALWAGKGSLGR